MHTVRKWWIFCDAQVRVVPLQKNEMFRTRCCGRRTRTKLCRSWCHWECWSTSSARTPTACIDCLEFLVTGCLNCMAMHSTNAVRSAVQSTSVHLARVLTARLFPSTSVCTVTVIIVREESVNARLEWHAFHCICSLISFTSRTVFCRVQTPG